MEKFNEFKIYDEKGMVKDPKIANEMADAEKPYREKRFGIFNPSKKTIQEGERIAEELAEYQRRDLIHNVASSLEYLLGKLGTQNGTVVSLGYYQNQQENVPWYEMSLDVTDKISIKFSGTAWKSFIYDVISIEINGVKVGINELDSNVLGILYEVLKKKAEPYLLADKEIDKEKRELEFNKEEEIKLSLQAAKDEKERKLNEIMGLFEETPKKENKN